ncbi:PLP-dependent aminotransferase family protein [Enterobacteriaceae bacterium H11S18]|uniref:MocR-like pyridoxine biosynthesis transcription factor PdxR n=1 Tax=Dryocola clanedunensis TaxID=2925396 RepID=UPI0022F0F3E6|nr:PLP-dependent aminotransferase family protein [Dryocola clanedunensis]MCT4712106.1 PLP-dependent aminotransferase family protein [Dryocola clanedunensis]
MSRKANVLAIPAIGKLDRKIGQLSQQLAQALRNAIHKGELKAGDMLPSTRSLAASLELARGTVLEAFEQLVAEGFLESKRGSGTCVIFSPQTIPSPKVEPTGDIFLTESAQKFARVAERIKTLSPRPFAVSVPVGDTAPDDIWRKIGNRIRARGPGAPSGYGEPQGVRPLREAICEYVRKSRSVHCTPEQIIITSGTQQGLYLATQILLDSGDTAWVEDPGYPGMTDIFETAARDRKMVRIPVDAEGLDVEAGKVIAPQARAAFVTPSHQYPLGMPLSMSRRAALIDWAKTNHAWVIEDDYDSEMRYAGQPFPALQGMGPNNVIYLGTFSKILFPSLRLGYVIAPEPLINAFNGARILMDRHPPSADQYVLAKFMSEGHLNRHLRKMRSVYAEKRRVLMEAVTALISPDLATLQPTDQGMHMVLWLPGFDDREVVRKGIEAGISLRAVSHMFSAGNSESGVLLGLGGFTDEEIYAAVGKLGQLLAAMSRDLLL